MILYHGSPHLFIFPEYPEMTLMHETSFPIGLWTSTTKEDARKYGRHVYELSIGILPVLLASDALIDRPRHIHIRDHRDVIMTRDRQHVVIINFDVITSFRYIEDQAHNVVQSLRG